MNNGNFFNGRNGADELSVTLIVLGVVSYLAYPIFTVAYAQYICIALAIALIVWGIFRAFSTNLVMRRRENDEFVSFVKGKPNPEKEAEKARKKAEKEAQRLKDEKRKEDLKTHAYFKCPKCGQELRVPKGKGRIRIRCPKCGEQFERTT